MLCSVVKDSVFSLGVLKYLVCLCKGYDGCCIFWLYCEARRGAVGARVSSCRHCMFVSCVHPVAVINAAFCMSCSLLMLIKDERGDHMEEEDMFVFYVCCSDCVGVCGNVCCVALLKISFFSLGVLTYIVCLCKDMMDVVFSGCIVRRGVEL